MGISKKTFTRKDGSVYEGWNLSFRDHDGNRRNKSFKTKAKAAAYKSGLKDVTTTINTAKMLNVAVSDAARHLQGIGQIASASEVMAKVPDHIETIREEVTKEKTIATFITDFLIASERGRDGKAPLKRTTVESYRERLSPFKEKYGNRLPSSMTRSDFIEYRDWLLDCGRYSTRNSVRNIFTSAVILFNWLVESKEVIPSNPGKKVPLEVADREAAKPADENEIYTDEEIGKLIAAATAYIGEWDNRKEEQDAAYRDRAVTSVLIFCGMRIGEVLALTRDKVDLDKRLIEVRSTQSKYKEVTTVKSEAGNRWVVIPTLIVPFLKEWLARHNHNRLFPTSTGEPLTYHNFRRSWVRLTELAGVPFRNIHNLRHYYVSKLIENNHTEDAITRMIGHESIAFTRRVYGHIIDKQKRLRTDADLIDDTFAGIKLKGLSADEIADAA